MAQGLTAVGCRWDSDVAVFPEGRLYQSKNGVPCTGRQNRRLLVHVRWTRQNVREARGSENRKARHTSRCPYVSCEPMNAEWSLERPQLVGINRSGLSVERIVGRLRA